MKPFTKFLSLILSFVLLLSFSACSSGPETPEAALAKCFKALKKHELNTVQKYFSYNELVDFGNEQQTALAKNEEYSKYLFSKLSYHINSSETEGDTATLDLNITNTDYQKLITQFVSQVANMVAQNSALTESERQSETQKIYLTLIASENNETVTKRVYLKMEKNGDSWKFVIDKSFQNAMLGGLVTAASMLKF